MNFSLTQTNLKENPIRTSVLPVRISWIETHPYASFIMLMRTSYETPAGKLTDLRTHRCGLSHEDESWVMRTPAPRREVPMLTEIGSCTWEPPSIKHVITSCGTYGTFMASARQTPAAPADCMDLSENNTNFSNRKFTGKGPPSNITYKIRKNTQASPGHLTLHPSSNMLLFATWSRECHKKCTKKDGLYNPCHIYPFLRRKSG